MLVNIINDIESLFFPKLCLGCEDVLSMHEDSICTRCFHELPLTNFHLQEENPVKKIFYGRVKIENATALLYFEKKNITQTLIHHLKYKRQEHLGDMLGNWMGETLKNNPKYQDVDFIIPVPLHKKKLRKRGYNQLTLFGKALSKNLNAVFDDTILLRLSDTKTQTLKSRVKRWDPSNTRLSLHNEECLAHRHILLIDDIITSGATLEACIQTLQEVKNIKISIATIAVTS